MNNIKRLHIFKNGTAVIRPKVGFRPFNEGYTPNARRQGKPANNGAPVNIPIHPPAPKGGSGVFQRPETGEGRTQKSEL